MLQLVLIDREVAEPPSLTDVRFLMTLLFHLVYIVWDNDAPLSRPSHLGYG